MTVSKEELENFDWDKSKHHIPNVFVVRPSLFLNSSHEYFLRDDGDDGLMGLRTKQHLVPSEVFQQQHDIVSDIMDRTQERVVLFIEEMPLNGFRINPLVPYKVHSFYGNVDMIQVRSGQNHVWFDTDGNIIGSTTEDDMSSVIPEQAEIDALCTAAHKISLEAKIPYVRTDFVLSSRGPIFKSFACVPADVRASNNAFAAFYDTQDSTLETAWASAENRIIQDNTDEDSEEPVEPVEQPTDDNA